MATKRLRSKYLSTRPSVGPASISPYGPYDFQGVEAVDGTDGPWYDAALGSTYIRTAAGAVAEYLKVTDVGASSDWFPLPVEEVFNVKQYGAVGDGATDDITAIEAAVAAANTAGGGTVYFPAGTYVIAHSTPTEDRLTFDTIDHVKLVGDGDVIFISSDGGGTSDGAWMTLDTCNYFEMSGITIEDTVKTRWQSYDNALVILDSNHVHIHHCEFGWLSNKHIHVHGTCQDVNIYDNEFHHAGFNATPGSASATVYGSIFLYTVSGATPTVALSDVRIFRNHFHDNYAMCVAVNNSNLATYPDQVIGVHIYDNVFENCSGGVSLRARQCTAHDNIYRNIGWSYITDSTLDTFYYYVTTSDAHDRYYSKTRSDNSTTAYTAPPSDAQTILPSIMAVIYIGNGADIHVYNETFENCSSAQVLDTGATAASASIYYGVSPNRPVFRDCSVNEEDAAAAYKTPLIWLATEPQLATVEGNKFYMPQAFTGTNAYLVRVDGIGHHITNNLAKNFGPIYYAVTNLDHVSRAAAAPSSGTYPVGSIHWDTNAAAGATPGWYCTAAGTAGTLNESGTTATTTATSATITVNAATGLTVGDYITIAGVTGIKRVVTISSTTVVVDSVCAETVGAPGGAVAFSAPTWNAFANLAA